MGKSQNDITQLYSDKADKIAGMQLNKSSNWDEIEPGVNYVNTYGGSGGTNYPPLSGIGLCFTSKHAYGQERVQIANLSTGIAIRNASNSSNEYDNWNSVTWNQLALKSDLLTIATATSLASITKTGFYVGKYMGEGDAWMIGLAIVQSDGTAICISVNSKNGSLYTAYKASGSAAWVGKKIA